MKTKKTRQIATGTETSEERAERLERELSEAKVAKVKRDAEVKELRLQVRRLINQVGFQGRLLAKTRGPRPETESDRSRKRSAG